MKIVELRAENFKKLVAVSISPKGDVVTISGKNGAGKSSVLDAIVAALGGVKHCPPKPIREGQDRAQVVVTTEDYIVKRRWTEKGSTLEVSNASGAKFGSPQSLLDKIVGSIAFDPLAYIALSPREQRQTLIDLLGIDLAKFDAEIAETREQRRLLLAEKERLDHEMEKLTFFPDAPEEEVSVAQLTDELTQAIDNNKGREQQERRINDLEAELAGYREKLAEISEWIAQTEAELVQERDVLKALPEIITITPLRERIAAAEQTNRNVRANARYTEVGNDIDVKADYIHRTYDQLQKLEADKAEALASVAMPVEGLGVTAEGVTFDGIPLEQVNHAKQLEVSLAIGMALNPKLRVMICNGNGLDGESLAALERLTREKDYQLWMERTDESGQVGIMIEDGTVKEGTA